MKSVIIVALLLFVSFGCKKVLKDPLDYYPEVEMVGAEVQSDGSVLVHGRVLSPGKYKGSEIINVGFCMMQNEEPAMMDNQVEGYLDGTDFYGIIPQFLIDENATHYIKAFGTNDFGYDLSLAKEFDSLYLDISAPCAPANMYYNFFGTSGYYDGVQEAGTDYYMCSHGNNRFYITFPTGIHAGVYQVNPYPALPNKVKCTAQAAGNGYPLENGELVYVEKLSSTSYKVTICGANVPVGQSSTTYTGSFLINL
ncbi:MAG: hypothetical protein V4638_07580 [Bacteroidota bacterium]